MQQTEVLTDQRTAKGLKQLEQSLKEDIQRDPTKWKVRLYRRIQSRNKQIQTPKTT